MKKHLLTMLSLAFILILLSSCGEKASQIEGTWYATYDAGMYQFKEGTITRAGQTVGQYDDNGDSVVISMIDGTENLELYITTSEGNTILADAPNGNCLIYFCQGLDVAEAYAKNNRSLSPEELWTEAMASCQKDLSSFNSASEASKYYVSKANEAYVQLICTVCSDDEINTETTRVLAEQYCSAVNNTIVYHQIAFIESSKILLGDDANNSSNSTNDYYMNKLVDTNNKGNKLMEDLEAALKDRKISNSESSTLQEDINTVYEVIEQFTEAENQAREYTEQIKNGN